MHEVEEKIITIENIFKENQKIELKDKLELFLNGVRLKVNMSDGLYRVYGKKNEFIGIGVVEDELLKRDVVV